MEQEKKPLKKIIIVLAVLLCISVAALVGVKMYKPANTVPDNSAVVPDNIITEESQQAETDVDVQAENETESNTEKTKTTATNNKNTTNNTPVTVTRHTDGATAIGLYKFNTGDNERFNVSNMFPGDSITENYNVAVSYRNRVTVNFKADIDKGYEKLAEVLKCKVVANGTEMYDGLMRDMPDAVKYNLAGKSEDSAIITYEITAYLDTSVGNEYMNKELYADFEWWVDASETENLSIMPPDTGDNSNAILWVSLAAGSAFMLIILLIIRRKKEEATDEQ